ncbi:MAG: GNAT family N-acetyltransferase [Lentisphaerae bacterium]|nr:GNAT family N-acetyltransferase [Lentisphaerota bacterium]MCP4103519.1 GNAT family N-acetyltransferase [Lentisphaerota bacterium]
MLIRQLKREDLDEISAAHFKAWYETYSPDFLPLKVIESMTLEKWRESWQRNLAPCNQDHHLCVQNNAGEITAFASFGANLDPQNSDEFLGRMLRIYVLKDYQGQGVGRALVQAGTEHLVKQGITSMTVHVVEANTPACRFYEHLGGEVIFHCLVDRVGYSIGEFTYGWRDIRSLLKPQNT